MIFIGLSAWAAEHLVYISAEVYDPHTQQLSWIWH